VYNKVKYVIKMGENKTEAETFQEWFKSQAKYKTQKEFAEATGIPRSTMSFYLQGIRKPLEEHRKILYKVTGLECFRVEIKMSEKKEEKKEVEIKGISEEATLSLHIQLQNWFESQTKWKTKKDLAKGTGIGYTNLKKYFHGDSQPSQKIRQKLYEVTGIEILRREIEIKKVEQKGIESLVELKTKEKEEIKKIKTPLDMQEKVTDLQKIILDLSERVNSFDGVCEKCIANKLPNSTEESSVKERVEIVKELLYALNRELEFFKHDSPESREMFRKRIHAPDVGYIIALLRALFDEDKFQSFLYMSNYDMKRR